MTDSDTISNERSQVSPSDRNTDILIKKNTKGVDCQITIRGFNSKEIDIINNQVDEFYKNHKGKALLDLLY